MKKTLIILSFTLLSICMDNPQIVAEKEPNGELSKNDLFVFISENIDVPGGKPDDKTMYDALMTTLFPTIEKEIINYYGYLKQFEDGKILKITRKHEGGFDFDIEVQVTTFEHAHNPPYGKETMTFNISPFGVKTVSFNHVGDALEKEINEFYKETLLDITQTFQLNLESYTSYTYNQLQYQAEVNDEFTSLFNIAKEIVTNILLPERKIPYKNVVDAVTFIKGHTGYLLFKMSDGTNVNYHVQKKDDHWIITDIKRKQGKEMDDKLPWYVWKNDENRSVIGIPPNVKL